MSDNLHNSTSPTIAQSSNANAKSPTPKSPTTNSPTPMCSAPMHYNPDGTVAWDQMWDSFCALASEGGPPHRSNMLTVATQEDPRNPAYQRVGEELIRGIQLVSGMETTHAKPGWLRVKCAHAAQARWMAEQIAQENVQSYAEGDFVVVPIASTYTVAAEIKNVITVVAKTSHYWQEHVLNEVKTLMAWESRIVGAWRALRSPKQ